MDFKKARILFMGTPEIAGILLEKMILDGYNIVGLVCQIDKPIGRKNIITPCPSKTIALKYNIPVFQPIKIRKDFEFVKSLNVDVLLTFAYGQILPQELLDLPSIGCVNLHGSLLPKYRGSAPIQWALINGEKTTGVTLMKMVKEMDAGCMYAKDEFDILDSDNNSSLFLKIADSAYRVVDKYLSQYINGTLEGIEQDQGQITFAPMISKEMEKLSLNQPCFSFINWVRGLAYNPGGYLFLEDKKMKIFSAKKVSNEQKYQLGYIIKASPKEGFLIQGLDGVISLLEIQEEGKKRMDYKSFTNGNSNLVSKILK